MFFELKYYPHVKVESQCKFSYEKEIICIKLETCFLSHRIIFIIEAAHIRFTVEF